MPFIEKPEISTHNTLITIISKITGIKLPKKNSNPLTEDVIKVLKVFFSFSSARQAATQYTPVIHTFISIPKERK